MIRTLRMAAVAMALVACDASRIVAPSASPIAPDGIVHASGAALPAVRFSEIHYDNAGTDAGEAIEISAPAGTDLTGWKIVLYNGNGGAAYNPTVTLSGTVPNSCSGRGVVVTTYAVNALQNGDPDGIALVDNNNVVVEFLSYGGTMTAVGGAAAGMVSQPMGAKESSTTPIGFSLQRNADGTWNAPAANTFGSCNDGGAVVVAGPLAKIVVSPATASVIIGNSQTFTAKGFDADNIEVTSFTPTWSTTSTDVVTVNATTGAVKGDAIGDAQVIATSGSITGSATVHVVAPPPPPTGVPATRISEIHYDNSGTDANEAIEIEGNAGVSLDGWKLQLHTGSTGLTYRSIPLTGVFAASCNGRGAISIPVAGLQNGGLDVPEPDGVALVNAAGQLVEFLSYEGSFTATDSAAAGVTSTDIGVAEGSSASATQSLQRSTDGVTWNKPADANFGVVNACAAGGTPGAASISITANGPDTLVVGWQRRGFATLRDANGTTVSGASFTWTSDTPLIATVDNLGYVTATGAGTAIIRATSGATSGTYKIAIINYEPTKATYRNHVEFGAPTGMDPANNVLLEKGAYVTSYNPARGGPNWVSWNLNASHFGDADRCECFSADLALPAAQRITDQDYVNGGYDRGHMVQSESRTSTHSENASTFLLTQILPQAGNTNQGPWLGFENYTNDFARLQGKELYIVAGGEYAANPTTLKNAGRVAIPDFTWKVVVVMSAGKGLADVHSTADLQVIAIRMPNLVSTAPAKNNVWQPWVTTVDEIEARTGLDLLNALPDNIERAVESNDHPPVAVIGGATTGLEGASLAFDGAGTTDQDAGDVLTYAWSFGDGTTAAGINTSHTYAEDGSYTVTLTVTDAKGVTDEATRTVVVSNAAPVIAAFSGATILRGEDYASAGTFSDAGLQDTWTATVNFGDGATQPLALSGNGFSLAHTYTTAGTFTVTVTVTDDDGASTTRTATVTVASPIAAIGTLMSDVTALVANGTLSSGEGSALTASLRNAQRNADGTTPAAVNELEAFINKLEAMQRAGRMTAATAESLAAYAGRIIASIG